MKFLHNIVNHQINKGLSIIKNPSTLVLDDKTIDTSFIQNPNVDDTQDVDTQDVDTQDMDELNDAYLFNEPLNEFNLLGKASTIVLGETIAFGSSHLFMQKEDAEYKKYGYGATTGWGTAIGQALITGLATAPIIYGVNKANEPFVDTTKRQKKYKKRNTDDVLQNLLILQGPRSVSNFYHGYKRHNDSFWWGLGWSFFGSVGLSLAQGYAKPLPIKSNEKYYSIDELKAQKQGNTTTPTTP